MKLAVNYLRESRELWEQGKIDFIDYFKLYSLSSDLSPLAWCVTQRDLLFHGLVGGGSDIASIHFWNEKDIELQKEYYKIGHTPYISVHINRDEGETETPENALTRIVENVSKLKEIFGMEVILENVPASYDSTQKHFLSNPDFITEAVEKSKSGFLFDIGHARVAADALHIPFEEYVRRLPMNHLMEIHLSGCIETPQGRLRAPHKAMNEEDYLFLEQAIQNYPTIQTVTLEYGPFIDKEGTSSYPIVSFNQVNPIALEEVYEQLIRIKNIINKGE